MNATEKNQTDRRKFLQRIAAGSLAALALPDFSFAYQKKSLPPAGNPADELFWQAVKGMFEVPDHMIMMNAANLCPSPKPINERVYALNKELEANVSFQYRAVFAQERARALEALAKFIGAAKEEIGITRNTSESNCTIVNGLDFKAGDEIIIWEQNHPSNSISWEKRAKRDGLVIKKIAVPASPKYVDELVAPFAKAISTRTKVIAFSHVSNVSGLALPAREICDLARSKGVLTLVDGAQTLGFMDINLKDLGCDFFTASTHKWLMGPLENGMLYMKAEHIEKIWPNVIGGGWKEEGKTVDEKLCILGQRNETTASALPETLNFSNTISRKSIEQRVRDLNTYLKEQIQAKVPKAIFVTPLSPVFSGGIVIVQVPGKETKVLYEKLYDVYGIACANSGGVRFSPHIYNTKEDIDRAVKGLSELAA